MQILTTESYNTTGGMTNLQPRGLIGRTYVEDNPILQYTEIYKLWALWFQRFFCFFHYKSIVVIDPQGMASLDPCGRIFDVEH